MCVHTFRSWAGELGITRLGPIPELGLTCARNFLITYSPLVTCYSMLNSHAKSIHILSDLYTRALLVTTSATGGKLRWETAGGVWIGFI